MAIKLTEAKLRTLIRGVISEEMDREQLEDQLDEIEYQLEQGIGDGHLEQDRERILNLLAQMDAGESPSWDIPSDRIVDPSMHSHAELDALYEGDGVPETYVKPRR